MVLILGTIRIRIDIINFFFKGTCHNLAKWLSYYLYFFSFSLLHRKEYRKVSHDHSYIVTSHDKSHDGCGKIVHRLCSSCISSVQEIEKDFIKFSLST